MNGEILFLGGGGLKLSPCSHTHTVEFLGELVEMKAEGITTEEVVGVGEAEVVSADSESGVELETVSRVELETGCRATTTFLRRQMHRPAAS